MTVHGHEGVLHYLFGSADIAHQQDGQPDELTPVGGVQLLQSPIGAPAADAHRVRQCCMGRHVSGTREATNRFTRR